MAVRRAVVSVAEAASMGANAAWLDASFHLPTSGRNARKEFEAGPRIPDAVFWDIDAIATPSNLPHMVPDGEAMMLACAGAGIQDGARPVVVYDTVGVFSSPRLWWLLRVYGHSNVYVLDGGLPAWEGAGMPLAHGTEGARFADDPGAARPAVPWLHGAPPHGTVAELEEVAVAGEACSGPDDVRTGGGRPVAKGPARLSEDGVLLVDARPAGRFEGDHPEPRSGLVSGHVPGSASLPSSALTPEGSLLSRPELLATLRAAGVDPFTSRRIVTTCGSGVTAAVISLALAEVGRDISGDGLFDGAWAQYGDETV